MKLYCVSNMWKCVWNKQWTAYFMTWFDRFQAKKQLLVPTPMLHSGLFNRIIPPDSGAATLKTCATRQVSPSASLTFWLGGARGIAYCFSRTSGASLRWGYMTLTTCALVFRFGWVRHFSTSCIAAVDIRCLARCRNFWLIDLLILWARNQND